jgi:PAS domain S-box-containing protein
MDVVQLLTLRLRLLPWGWRWAGGMLLALAAVGLHALLPHDESGEEPGYPGLLSLLLPTLTLAAVLFGPMAALVPAALGLLAGGMILGLSGLAPSGPAMTGLAVLLALTGLVTAASAELRYLALRRLRTQNASLLATQQRLHALTEAGALILWRADPAGRVIESRGWEALTGQPEAAMRGEGWMEVVHPQDVASTRTIWAEALATRQAAEAEFRIRTHDGVWRWVRARAVPVLPAGEAGRAVEPVEWAGVVEDVDPRRQAEERRMLIARELDHRAKNLLAVVQAVLRLTRAEEPQTYASAVEGRITALARAHALLTQGDWLGADLRELAAQELAAYGGLGDRVTLSGPRLALTPAAAQAFSLVLHELATNTAKYGALSAANGRLLLSWEVEGDRLRLLWEECGGPPLAGPPARRGFGSRLVEATVRDQLGGQVRMDWNPAGLLCRIEAPLRRILARA